MAKLFPHDALEGLDRVLPYYDKLLRTQGPEAAQKAWRQTFIKPRAAMEKAIGYFQDVLKGGATFDFGTLRADDAHVEFAATLMEHNHFVDFFPTCIVRNTADTNRILHILGGNKYGGLDYYQLCIVDQKYCIPFLSVNDAKIERSDKGIFVSCSSVGVFVKPPYKCIDPTGQIYTSASIEDVKPHLFGDFAECMGLMAMLSCREVEKVIVPAPDKLNRNRTNAHKPPIRERTEIKINVTRPALKVEYQTDDTISDRKSPRPHWRRGHPRRLPKSGLIKLIPPTWVMWDEDSPLPKPLIKNYRVT